MQPKQPARLVSSQRASQLLAPKRRSLASLGPCPLRVGPRLPAQRILESEESEKITQLQLVVRCSWRETAHFFRAFAFDGNTHCLT